MKKILIGIIFCLSLSSCSKDIENTDNDAVLFGIVSDLETGNPISNVSVDLCEGLAWDCLGASIGRTFTGTDGFFQINDINPDESYFIIFQHVDYKTTGQRLKLKAGEKTELNMAMTQNK